MTRHTFTIGHLFAGAGGGAYGAQRARVAIGQHRAEFRTLGGIDIDPEACKDFEYLVDAPCAPADLHKLQPGELRRAWGPEPPDMVLLSPPCKGFSSLLSKKLSTSEKYQRLNELVVRGLFLLCSTWDRPPPIIFLENVPRITSRGKELLARARKLLRVHGYRVTEDDYHDCGELGGLAQHRKRFFLVARCEDRVPNFIYEPASLRVKACGEVLGPLPTPGDTERGGAMHVMPQISWLNWVRLALIPAGGDWRDLPGVVPEGKKRREVHRRHMVADWNKPVDTIAGSGSNGVGNVADPRIAEALGLKQTAEGAGSFKGRPGLFAVADWQKPVRTVTGAATVSGSSGVAAIADPRVVGLPDKPGRHLNQYRVLDWERPANTVTGASRPGSGAAAVADPRVAMAPKDNRHPGVYGVHRWDQAAGVITGSAAISRGRFAVADPRLSCTPRAGAYGVLSWQEAAATIAGSLAVDNGKAAVADPRLPPLREALAAEIPDDPKKKPGFIPVIVAADGTWHRPLTTLELAALQGFPTEHKGAPLQLCGRATTAWRERIGNAIPPPAAQAIASEMLLALLAARLCDSQLRLEEIWVKDQVGDAVLAR